MSNFEEAYGKHELEAVIRAGTRGTIADVPIGSLALSTMTVDSRGSASLPSADLSDCVRAAATEQGQTLYEGACLSASFFWEGQSRRSYLDEKSPDIAYLRHLQERGIKWLEMEDYYVNRFAKSSGIASACLGLVVAKRYDALTEQFGVNNYDRGTKLRGEFWPGEVAFKALQRYLAS
jgi:uridine phosphorylase